MEKRGTDQRRRVHGCDGRVGKERSYGFCLVDPVIGEWSVFAEKIESQTSPVSGGRQQGRDGSDEGGRGELTSQPTPAAVWSESRMTDGQHKLKPLEATGGM